MQDILAVSHKRYQIEDCFRIMKTNFEARPVFHHKKERIQAHFLICYTALLVYRLLECKLNDGEIHVTTEQLINTLKNMNVVDDEISYLAAYKGSTTLNALSAMKDIGLDRKRYKPAALRKKIKNLLK